MSELKETAAEREWRAIEQLLDVVIELRDAGVHRHAPVSARTRPRRDAAERHRGDRRESRDRWSRKRGNRRS